jgi:hypothetical protein
LKHERTGELQSIKVGWSWTLFLFSQFWAIPLFYRQLFDWAMIQLVLTALTLTYGVFGEAESDLMVFAFVLALGTIGVSIFVGQRGNELTAKRMLRDGWVFAEPDAQLTQHAKRAWSLP